MPAETAFLRSILSNPRKAAEKCRKHWNEDDGPSSFVWATALLVFATKLVKEEEHQMKQQLRLQFTDQRGAMGLPLEVLALVFSYLSPQVAAGMRSVNRKLNGVVSLHSVPWTIVTDGFKGLGQIDFLDVNYWKSVAAVADEMCRRPSGRPALSVKGQSIKETNFASNGIAFCFGYSPPTKFLMECIERMQKLKRIQMPSNIGGKITDGESQSFDNSLYDGQCVARLIATRHCSDITHLVVTHVPCIQSVCRFPYLTSLLINFGMLNFERSHVAVKDFLLTVSEDILVLPHLKHLGLHDFMQSSVEEIFDVPTVVGMLESRPNLITLSLTGMVLELSDLIDLIHPKCGLRSLAFMASHFELYEMILDEENFVDHRPSSVSLFVLCTTEPPKPSLTSMLGCKLPGDLDLEALRVRNVKIAGQLAYDAYPLRRLGVEDIEWGLTGGALFAE
jgi:hypothetical protein